MVLVRRDVLGVLFGVIASAALGTRTSAPTTRGTATVTKELPPFELQGTHVSLASLAANLVGYTVVRGAKPLMVWLRSSDGTARLLGVDQRDVLPMFEVFTLNVATADELEERMRDWQPPAQTDDLPEPLRRLMSVRPTAPLPPAEFDPWPFSEWRTQVLRRAEFIIEDPGVEGTFGNNPNVQSASRPNSVPSEATASCEVAAGVLFTSPDGRRLLIGVDWLPMNLVVSETAVEIDAYLEPCDAVDLTAYLGQLSDLA
jgi:hypothetical protein